MLMQHIALVPEADGVSASELSRVSAALQTQVLRDFAPLWNVHASVVAFPRLEEVPVGYWPIILSREGLGREAGIHRDEHGQPYAHIELVPEWSLAASRTCLEMLANPFGERSVTAPSLRTDQGFVQYLIEVCGPLLDAVHSYMIHDVSVSDFCTPAFYSAKSRERELLSFLDVIRVPFQLVRGGQLMWNDPISNSWWMRSHFGDNPVDTQLGACDERFNTARELARKHQVPRRPWRSLERDAQNARRRVTHQQVLQASQNRAFRLRALLGRHLEEETRLLSAPVTGHPVQPRTVRPTGFEDHDFPAPWDDALHEDVHAGVSRRVEQVARRLGLETGTHNLDLNEFELAERQAWEESQVHEDIVEAPQRLPDLDPAEPSSFGHAMGNLLGSAENVTASTLRPLEFSERNAGEESAEASKAAYASIPPPLPALDRKQEVQNSTPYKVNGTPVQLRSEPVVALDATAPQGRAHPSFPPVSNSVFVDNRRGSAVAYGGTLLGAALLVFGLSAAHFDGPAGQKHATRSAAPRKSATDGLSRPTRAVVSSGGAVPSVPGATVPFASPGTTTSPLAVIPNAPSASDTNASSPASGQAGDSSPKVDPRATVGSANSSIQSGQTPSRGSQPEAHILSGAPSDRTPQTAGRRLRAPAQVTPAAKVSTLPRRTINQLLDTRE